MKTLHTNPEHEVAYQDLCNLCMKHKNAITPMELLAIASNMVGKILAMQDQMKYTAAMAMEVVAENIEFGNKQVIAELLNSKGSA